MKTKNDKKYNEDGLYSMEQAPKDGQEILVYNNMNKKFEIVYWVTFEYWQQIATSINHIPKKPVTGFHYWASKKNYNYPMFHEEDYDGWLPLPNK